MEMAEWDTYMKYLVTSCCSSIFECALRWKNDCRKRVHGIFSKVSAQEMPRKVETSS